MSTLDKREYLSNIRQLYTKFDQLRDQLSEMGRMYWARGYGSGGANEITQDDINASQELSPMVVADVGTFITFCEDIDKLCNNQSVSTGDRNTQIAKLRQTPNIY